MCERGTEEGTSFINLFSSHATKKQFVCPRAYCPFNKQFSSCRPNRVTPSTGTLTVPLKHDAIGNTSPNEIHLSAHVIFYDVWMLVMFGPNCGSGKHCPFAHALCCHGYSNIVLDVEQCCQVFCWNPIADRWKQWVGRNKQEHKREGKKWRNQFGLRLLKKNPRTPVCKVSVGGPCKSDDFTVKCSLVCCREMCLSFCWTPHRHPTCTSVYFETEFCRESWRDAGSMWAECNLAKQIYIFLCTNTVQVQTPTNSVFPLNLHRTDAERLIFTCITCHDCFQPALDVISSDICLYINNPKLITPPLSNWQCNNGVCCCFPRNIFSFAAACDIQNVRTHTPSTRVLGSLCLLQRGSILARVCGGVVGGGQWSMSIVILFCHMSCDVTHNCKLSSPTQTLKRQQFVWIWHWPDTLN